MMLSFAYVSASTPPAAQPYSAAMRGAFNNEYAWSGVDDWSTAAPLPDAANVDWWGDLDPDAGAWLILLRKPAHDDDLQRDLDSPSVEPGLPSLLQKYCAGTDAAWSSLTTTFTELLALGPVEYAYSTGVYPSFEAAAHPQAHVPKFLTRLSTPRNVLFPTHTVAMFWTTVRKMEGALGAFVTEGLLVDGDLPVEIRKTLDEMKVSMVLDLPLNGEFNEFPISATGVKYTHSPTDYKRLYKEEMKPPREGRDVPHPPFLSNKEGSAPPFFKFREVLGITTHVASANRSNYDIGVYEAAFNAGPAESLVNLGLFDGLNAESLPSFHRYMSRGNEFYADKTFMLTPVLIGNFDYEGLVEVVEEGFLASDRLEENTAFYGPTTTHYGNGENTLDIHAMYSVMGNAHIYYAVSSPYLSPLMSYLMIYLLPHPTAPPPFLSSSYGYSGHFGFSRALTERLDTQFGLVRKLGANLVLAAGDASLYAWEYADFPLARGSPNFGPSAGLSHAIQVGGYSPEAADPNRFVPMGRFPTAPASNYQLFGTAGGVQVGSYELNANRRAVCDTYLDWLTYNALHGQATTMPSIFVSNAGTGRCVPDVVGLGFTVAVQNGTAAGLIGGTSLAAPQTAAVWALRGHQDHLHNRDIMYWLYAGRGGDLPKTDAYSGSIGTGFDQGWQSSGGYTAYDLVYGLGRAHDRDLMPPVSVAGMATPTPNATHSPSAAGLTTHAKDDEEVTYEEDGWATYDEAIEAEAASTVAAAPTAAEHRNTTRPNATAARWHNGTGTHKSNASGSYVYTYNDEPSYAEPSYAEGDFGGGVVIVDGEPTAYGNGSGWGWGQLYMQFAIICLVVLLCCCARREISRRWRLTALRGFGPTPEAPEERNLYGDNSYSPYAMKQGTYGYNAAPAHAKEYEGPASSSFSRLSNPFNRL